MAFIALQGRPGSGKSTMWSTFVNLGYHVHYIDMDKKLKSTGNLKPLLDEGKISAIECPEPLSTRKLGQLARTNVPQSFPLAQPKGYMWVCDYIDNLEKTIEDLGHDPSKTVPVIDSLSAVNRHLKQLIRYYVKAPKPGFDGWDTILQNYQALFDALRALTPEPFPHIGISIHTRDDVIKDGESTKVECRPFIDGQFRDELASYLEEFYFLEVETFGKSGTPKYVALTAPVGPVKHARTSQKIAVKVPSDFAQIFEKEE